MNSYSYSYFDLLFFFYFSETKLLWSIYYLIDRCDCLTMRKKSRVTSRLAPVASVCCSHGNKFFFMVRGAVCMRVPFSMVYMHVSVTNAPSVQISNL